MGFWKRACPAAPGKTRNTTRGSDSVLQQAPAMDGFRRSSLSRLWRALLPALALGLLLGSGVVVNSATAATKKRAAPAKKKPAAKPAAKRSAAARKPAARKPAARKKPAARTSRARAVRKRTPARNARIQSQRSPATARLREIQEALRGNGFLDTEPNGKWDDVSISAMKRFQEEHDIAPNGKINALSLIALGLGPKRGPAPGAASVIEPAGQAAGETPASDSNERR